MKEICNDSQCTGCGACMNACPKHCIHMDYNERAMLVPVIDEKKCADCGLCQKICPGNKVVEGVKPVKAYAAWTKDELGRKYSSSGGAAAVFYHKVISDGGIVYGCAYNKDLQLVHMAAATIKDINQFRGSKYSQSYIGYTYQNVRKQLEQNKEVLFIGTPCQISGLRKYLRRDYENLITVDLVCHGVPSQKLLDEHIHKICKNKRANQLTFRGRENNYFTLYEDFKKVYCKYRFSDTYYLAFLRGLIFRDSCYQCKYAKEERISDLTIGDFWGLGNKRRTSISDLEKDRGISLILINTPKGNAFFERCKHVFEYEERPVEEAIEGNAQLHQTSKKHPNIARFYREYKEYGFDKAANDCLKEERKKVRLECVKEKIKKYILHTA